MASAAELIVSIVGNMEGLKKTLQGAQAEIGNMGKSFSKLGSDMSSAGAGLTTGLTVPLTAVAVAGAGLVSWASNVEQSQGKVQASLGLTAEQADALNQAAMNVWKQGFGTDLDAVNQVIVSIRQNMGELAGKELENVTIGAMNISSVFGEDVNAVTAAAGVLMKNFGIDGQKALDIITVGYQKGGNFSGELLDTLREYSPQFKSMGLSAEDFLGILIKGAQSGAWNLDKIGDSVKEFNIRAQDGSDTTMKGFAAIGLNMDDISQKISAGGDTSKQAFMATVAGLAAMKDPVKQNIAGVALFGTQWEDVRKNVITAMTSGIGSIKDVTGATQKAAEDVSKSNPMAELTTAMRDMQSQILPIVTDQIIPMVKNDLIPIFRDTLIPIFKNDILPTVEKAVKAFSDMSPETQKLVIGITAFAAAIGPILVILGAVASGIGAISALFAAGGALATAGTIISGLIAGITALGAPILILIGVVALLVVAWTRDWGGIQTYARMTWDWITTTAAALYNRLEYTYHAMIMSVSILRDRFSEIWDLISSALSIVWDAMTLGLTFWYSRSEANYNRIVALAQWLHTQFSAVWNQISGALSQIWDYIIGLFNTWYNNFQNNCNRILNAGRSLYTDLARVWTDIENRFNNAKDTVIQTLQRLRDDSGTEANNIVNRILNPFSNIKASLEGFFNDVYQAGKNLVQNLIDGIESMIPDLGDTVSEIADTAAKYLPMNSPSKVGPLSRLPKWDDIFVNPLRLSMSKMPAIMEAGINSMIMGPTNNNVSTIYEGSQISIGPNNISGTMDIQQIVDEINRRVTAQRRARGYIL